MSIDDLSDEGEEYYSQLDEDPNTISIWTDSNVGPHLSKVLKEFKHAVSLLGPEKIRTAHPAQIVLTIPIDDVLNTTIATAIELNPKEPVVITFDFMEFRSLNYNDKKLPLPKTDSRQWTTTNFNSFGIKYHLREIVSRYMEDHWKWARESGDQLKGAFGSYVSQAKDPKNDDDKKLDEKAKDELIKMGFNVKDAVEALKKNAQNVSDAVNWLLSGNTASSSQSTFEDDEDAKIAQMHSDANFESELCVSKHVNLFVGLAAHVRLRLKSYNHYCMICHKKHKCNSEKPVVCCNSLCVFRYSELLPANKTKKFADTVDRITICPFTNCETLSSISQDEMVLSTVLGEYAEKEREKDHHLMLELYSHRYLNNDDVLKFVKALKTQGMAIEKLENVLKPELVNDFEQEWSAMKSRNGEGNLSTPNIAYHGTSETNINSILDRGLLVPGVGKGKDVAHKTDNGWWGKGIYLSPDASLSLGYSGTSNKLLVCAVLMGRSYKCTARMDGKPCVNGYNSHIDPSGKEWIVFSPSQVIPCYLVSFRRTGPGY
eukprot:TRINITY_DN6794_c0_g2_i1.p1 TRINITY_DN6794_c0_g2~~TRINITY_DN6794_c0_g2_i1.p1  ORF type:complete len:598 (-),score=118.29 TRINITY_DN6794_c0_g2_i1:48-1679(-)